MRSVSAPWRSATRYPAPPFSHSSRPPLPNACAFSTSTSGRPGVPRKWSAGQSTTPPSSRSAKKSYRWLSPSLGSRIRTVQRPPPVCSCKLFPAANWLPPLWERKGAWSPPARHPFVIPAFPSSWWIRWARAMLSLPAWFTPTCAAHPWPKWPRSAIFAAAMWPGSREPRRLYPPSSFTASKLGGGAEAYEPSNLARFLARAVPSLAAVGGNPAANCAAREAHARSFAAPVPPAAQGQLDERPLRPAILPRKIPYVLPIQPRRPYLGRYALGACHQS